MDKFFLRHTTAVYLIKGMLSLVLVEFSAVWQQPGILPCFVKCNLSLALLLPSQTAAEFRGLN